MRRRLVGFLFFAVGVAVVMMVAVGALLVRVRDDAHADVDRMLTDSVADQIGAAAERKAEHINDDLVGLLDGVTRLAATAADAYTSTEPVDPHEVARYVDGPDGTYHTATSAGVSMFYSGVVPVGDEQKETAARLAAIDPSLTALVVSAPLVAQAYLNSADGLTRIYPGLDVLSVFQPGLDAKDFSFYYLADGQHDPTKAPVLTDPYVDPAGQGWITSAIAPVYVGDRLEAVVGLDIPLDRLAGRVLAQSQPFGGSAMLVDPDGAIISMTPEAQDVLGIEDLGAVVDDIPVVSEQSTPDELDLGRRTDTVALNAALSDADSGRRILAVAGSEQFVAWSTLDDGWRMVLMVDRTTVEDLHEPGQRLLQAVELSYAILLAGLFVFLVLLAWRMVRLGRMFTDPLEQIDLATAKIAAGEFRPAIPPAPVAEIERTGANLLSMGDSLHAAQQRMADDAELLREGEERYRTIFENVADPVLTVRHDGTVVDANDAAFAVFGSGFVARDFAEMLPTESWRTPGWHTVQLAGEPPRTLELSVGTTGSGDDLRYTITAHDTTAAEAARALLEEARATAEHTSQMKDEFLASMSHEIRTPLNGVVGVLSLLADRELPPDARHELEVARKSADDLLVLVNDVLDFSKIEANRVSVVSTDVRLADVLEGVRRLYEPLAAEQGDDLQVTIDPTLPEWVRIDPTRVRQVLMNLVSNALKFTEQGRVEIAVRRDPPATSPMANAAPFDLRFEVIDDGVGIEPELQQRLFTRFTQGDPVAARRYPGTGLGLAIAKRLAELMGGRVGVRSEVGVGSTFWFTVRSGSGTPGADGGEAARAATGVGPLKVLVAEDNEVNLYLMVAILERLGHTVTAVVNGREAVEAAQHERFDLVLMDVQMPVANGIDATQAIRSLPGPMRSVPILAVTANVLPEQQALYRSVGFSGWVPKPVTLEHVHDAIGTAMARAAHPTAVKPATPPAVPETEPVAAQEPEPELFDRVLIEEYRSVLGDAASADMIEVFRRTVPERLGDLRRALTALDVDEARRVGHAMKGAAAAVGAVRMAAAAELLQHAADGDVDRLAAAVTTESAAALAAIGGAWSVADPGPPSRT